MVLKPFARPSYTMHNKTMGCLGGLAHGFETMCKANIFLRIIQFFIFLGFTFAIGAHSMSEEFVGFSPLLFTQGKLFVSLVSCDYCCACYSLG